VITAAAVRHHSVDVHGADIFYREAGPTSGAEEGVVLLPHGYPCSSYAFRNLLPALGDRWRLIAPDLPGFGYSATPSSTEFEYTFAGYAQFLQRFTATLGLQRYVLWLHDYGSQFGLQLAMSAPERVAGLIIQNGDIYPDAFGPKYDFLKDAWNNPGPDARRSIADHVTLDGFRSEFVGELPAELADRISPDLWTLHWALMTPERVANLIRLLEDQPTTLGWFGDEQAYLREHTPPALIVWGSNDGYMPAPSARAYLRDLPGADVHVFDGGHWLLETHLGDVVPLVRDFLTRVYT
jgi:pimeloyl-ACP methyl ester carboxylesterase